MLRTPVPYDSFQLLQLGHHVVEYHAPITHSSIVVAAAEAVTCSSSISPPGAPRGK